jgi:hypothetical protein
MFNNVIIAGITLLGILVLAFIAWGLASEYAASGGFTRYERRAPVRPLMASEGFTDVMERYDRCFGVNSRAA